METLILPETEATLDEMKSSADERGCLVVYTASYYDRICETQMNLITFYPG